MEIKPDSENQNRQLIFQLSRQRRRVWYISGLVSLVCFAGLILSWLNPEIGAPLRPGLDFTGGTQIQLERKCTDQCQSLSSTNVADLLDRLKLSDEDDLFLPKLSSARVQLLDGGESLVVRLPFLTASQSQFVVDSIEPLAGPFQRGKQSINTIGPSLGGELLKSSLISLFVAFLGIAAYISFRYDRRYALLALVTLAHDVIIVCGIFAWLGLFISVEIDSLFAVALLTIAGYSVNDTVVIFDRIREKRLEDPYLPFVTQVDKAVSATLTRTLYTSGTTLLPLIALIIFGGTTLFWFAIALAIGVFVGSWSSIALAPSLLTLGKSNKIESIDDKGLQSSPGE